VLMPASLDQHSAQVCSTLARLALGHEVDRHAQKNNNQQENGYQHSHTANAIPDHAYAPHWAVSQTEQSAVDAESN
jgi:hypothetical protein